MEYLGLLSEIFFLAAGIYLYLFAIGRLQFKDAAANARAEAFRKSNAGWMRIAALLLSAIMLVNIFIHLSQLLAG
jgi:hypothetical protein